MSDNEEKKRGLDIQPLSRNDFRTAGNWTGRPLHDEEEYDEGDIHPDGDYETIARATHDPNGTMGG